MKHIITILLATVFTYTTPAHAEFAEGANAILASFGFNQGGTLIGFDYEHGYDRTYGIGGYFRLYPDNTNPNEDGITAIGAFVRPHFNRQNWDFYVSPGFGFNSYDPAGNADSEGMLGPSLGIGLLYDFNTQFSLGVEEFIISNWFGDDDYRGTVSNEIMLKVRFIFN